MEGVAAIPNGSAVEEQVRWSDHTLAAHAGLPLSHSSAATKACKGKALWQASVYDFDSVVHSQSAAYAYRRFKSPNGDELASAVAALEGAEAGLATSSGMGAIVSAILSVCKCGDILITHSDSYGGTREFCEVDLIAFGIHVVCEDVNDTTLLDIALTKALASYEKSERQARAVVFLESITNPLIRVANIPATAEVCAKHGALLIVDNTFATPLTTKPLKQGAQMVVHSVSKFLGGHAEVIAGVLVGSRQYVNEAAKKAARWGLTAAPFDAWLALQGVRTLQVRMERSWQTSAELAERLSNSQIPLQVNWAPNCSALSFEVPGGFEGANKAVSTFQLIRLSPSLGSTTSTVSHSASSSHRLVPIAERQRLGITDGLLRLSVGLEDVEDIWNDLYQGLIAASEIALSS